MGKKRVDGGFDRRRIHGVDLNFFSDFRNQSDGELTAEVLTEFFESFENGKATSGAKCRQLRAKNREVQAMKDSKNSFAGSAGEKPDFDCVKKIHGDADGNGFSVADFEFRELLKFVGDPVAEVERAGRPEFKGVA